jgi:hypothetical protein
VAEPASKRENAWLAPSVIVAIIGVLVTVYLYYKSHQNDNETLAVNLTPNSVSIHSPIRVVSVSVSGLSGSERARVTFAGNDVEDLSANSGFASGFFTINPTAQVGSFVVEVEGLSSGRHGSETLVVTS